MHLAQRVPVADQIDVADQRAVVRSLLLSDTVEAKDVATDADGVADVHAHVLLGLVAADHGDADDEDGDAEMRQVHAVEAARLPAERRQQPLPGACRLHPLVDVEHRAADDPRRQQQAERDQRFPSAGEERCAGTDQSCRQECPAQRPHQLAELCLLPADEGCDAHQEHRRQHQRHEDGIEIGRADRELAGAEGVDQQRVERAEQHRGAGDDEQHVVRQQQ